MSGFKRSVPSLTKKFNENAGYLTPKNKILSKKTNFSNETKVALRNVTNTPTPLRKKTPTALTAMAPIRKKIPIAKINVSSLMQPTSTENAVFVTPRKTYSAWKPLVSAKKITFGDVNSLTPSSNKRHTAFASKTPFLKTALVEKSNIENLSHIPAFKNTKEENFQFSDLDGKGDEVGSDCNIMDAWSENLRLSDDQFNLLFMEPSENFVPPTPLSNEPENQDELFFDHFFPSEIHFENCNYETTNGCERCDELSMLDFSFDLPIVSDSKNGCTKVSKIGVAKNIELNSMENGMDFGDSRQEINEIRIRLLQKKLDDIMTENKELKEMCMVDNMLIYELEDVIKELKRELRKYKI